VRLSNTRETKSDRKTRRNRQTDRDTHTYIYIYIERERETDRQTETETESLYDREGVRHCNIDRERERE
jgi:hypothetical protein